ncbi:unknown [Sinorhizobium phage PBC5]|uniref:SGNH/GDSL hydrolase family protein n=1 Tax=Sinorhizobium phage PBC5 TaxID=179237 RepID=UPI000009BF96|nr:SGNH/GDSL hydrolase family protein [Sinorhizobium phage PBC5]AAL49581.1 unknown [Sinorhizobium phage PBC5]
MKTFGKVLAVMALLGCFASLDTVANAQSVLDISGNSNSAADAGNGNRPPVAQRWPWLRVATTGETMVNRAFSGDMAQDQAFKGMGVTRAATTSAVVITDINDARLMNSARIDRYKEFVARIIGDIVLPVRKTWRSAQIVKTGPWANTQVDPIGMYANTAGVKASGTVNGTVVYVGLLVDNHAMSQGVAADVYIDGVNKGSISSDNIGANLNGNTYNGLRYGPTLVRFAGLAAGSHSVEVRMTTTGKNQYMAYIAGNGDQPDTATVVVGNGYKLNATGVASFGVTEAVSILYRDAVADVVNQFAADGFDVSVLNTFDAIDPNAHLMSDGLHWNAQGHIAVKSAVETALLP